MNKKIEKKKFTTKTLLHMGEAIAFIAIVIYGYTLKQMQIKRIMGSSFLKYFTNNGNPYFFRLQ